MTATVQSAAVRRRHRIAAAAAASDVEIDEVDKQLRADAAGEALRMPVTGRTSA